VPESVLVSALGAHVRIDLDGVSEADAAAIRDAWRDALEPSVAERGMRAEQTSPVVAAAISDDTATLLEVLSQRVTLAAIGQRTGALWMLHAAGVAADDGRVVVLVGPSGRGKTTAARVLGTTFGYVSDETVAIDDDGRVWSYRKPLSVVERSGEPKAQRSPSSLGLGALPDIPLRLAAIVLLDRTEDGPEQAVVEQVELGDALADLVAQSSYLTAMPAPLQSMAALAESVGGIRCVRYRDAPALVEVVHRLLAEPPPASAGVGRDARPVSAGRVAGEPAAGPVYSRTPHVDVLGLDDPDRLAVLHAGSAGAGTLHVLAGVAPALWRAADAASVSDLTTAALAAYGRPEGDPEELIEAALGELVAVGVIGTERWWRIRDDVAWVGEADRVVVLGLADSDGSPLALEGSAAAIWHALGEREWRTTDAVIDDVAAGVGVDRDAVAGDVGAFLESLEGMGLVELT